MPPLPGGLGGSSTTTAAPAPYGAAPTGYESTSGAYAGSSRKSGAAEGNAARDGRNEPTPAARRAKRFERDVRELRGCLAALPALQWRFAVLRAGIYTGEPVARRDVAPMLDLSRKRVRRLERSVLRTLRASERSSTCDTGDAGATAPASLGASVPPLALSSSLGGTTMTTATSRREGGSAASGSTDRDAERPSGDVAGFFDQASAPASIGGSLVVRPVETIATTALAIALLLLVAATAYIYLRREAVFRALPIRFDALRSTMALPGDVMPFMDGSELQVTQPAGDANGEVLEMVMFLPPSTESPPKHIHPGQSEDYEVLEGTLEVFVRDEWHTVEAGETASVPKREVHTFRVGDEPVRVRNVHAPGLDFEDYFATESALTRAGKIKSYSSPRAVLHYAVLLSEYRHCMVVADPSLRLLLRILAPVGRLLGFGRP